MHLVTILVKNNNLILINNNKLIFNNKAIINSLLNLNYKKMKFKNEELKFKKLLLLSL